MSDEHGRRRATAIEQRDAVIRELVEALEDWNNTPGNTRTHQWWLAWHEKKDTALARAKEMVNDG